MIVAEQIPPLDSVVAREQIRLLEPVHSLARPGFVHPQGTVGILLEHAGGGYVGVELRAVDNTRWYEQLTLRDYRVRRTGHVVMPCAWCGHQVPVEDDPRGAITVAFSALSGPEDVFEAQIRVCSQVCGLSLRARLQRAGTSFRVTLVPGETATPHDASPRGSS